VTWSARTVSPSASDTIDTHVEVRFTISFALVLGLGGWPEDKELEVVDMTSQGEYHCDKETRRRRFAKQNMGHPPAYQFLVRATRQVLSSYRYQVSNWMIEFPQCSRLSQLRS